MRKLFLFLAMVLAWGYSIGQSFQVKDLSNSAGRWEGKLTYLDYSSGKPYTMLANINIDLTSDKK
jgi:hypothetical protein